MRIPGGYMYNGRRIERTHRALWVRKRSAARRGAMGNRYEVAWKVVDGPTYTFRRLKDAIAWVDANAVADAS